MESIISVLSNARVLAIFWILRFVGPMTIPWGLPLTYLSNEKEFPDMKRATYFVLTLSVMILMTGCLSAHGHRPTACMQGSCAQAPENCASCDGSCGSCGQTSSDPDPQVPCRLCGGRGCNLCRRGEAGQAAPGPAMGAVAYPYYTTRGPRDFLARNPQSIGP